MLWNGVQTVEFELDFVFNANQVHSERKEINLVKKINLPQERVIRSLGVRQLVQVMQHRLEGGWNELEAIVKLTAEESLLNRSLKTCQK
jgi:hypothetical protein